MRVRYPRTLDFILTIRSKHVHENIRRSYCILDIGQHILYGVRSMLNVVKTNTKESNKGHSVIYYII